MYLLSGWFMTTAAYYLILCAARGYALYKYTRAKGKQDPKLRYTLEFAVYQRSGIFLCLLGVSYLLVCLRMYFYGDTIVFKGLVVYLVATVAFTKLSIAIYGILANRHLKGPIISTLKMISFTDAMVAIVVTQYTLIMLEEDSSHAMSSSALLGMGCSVVFFLMGIYMLLKKKKYPPPENPPESSDDGLQSFHEA